METSRAQGRRDLKGKEGEATAMMHQEEEEEEEEEEDDEQDADFELRFGSDEKKKRAPSRKGFSGGTAGVSSTTCQVENCSANMSNAKQYHRRHKVCELHAKAALVLIDRIQQRFCQQCSRFHVISEFDGAKRSCRKRLLGHNERRRKTSSEIFHGQSSS